MVILFLISRNIYSIEARDSLKLFRLLRCLDFSSKSKTRYSGSQTHEVQNLLISVIGDWGLGIRDWGLGIRDWGLGIRDLLGYTRVSFPVTNSREFRLRKAKSARSSAQQSPVPDEPKCTSSIRETL